QRGRRVRERGRGRGRGLRGPRPAARGGPSRRGVVRGSAVAAQATIPAQVAGGAGAWRAAGGIPPARRPRSDLIRCSGEWVAVGASRTASRDECSAAGGGHGDARLRGGGVAWGGALQRGM